MSFRITSQITHQSQDRPLHQLYHVATYSGATEKVTSDNIYVRIGRFGCVFAHLRLALSKNWQLLLVQEECQCYSVGFKWKLEDVMTRTQIQQGYKYIFISMFVWGPLLAVLRIHWDQSAKPFQLLELSVRIYSLPQIPLPQRKTSVGSHKYCTTLLPQLMGSIDLFDTMWIYEAASSVLRYQSVAQNKQRFRSTPQ